MGNAVVNFFVGYLVALTLFWVTEPLWLNSEEEKEHWSEQDWWTNRHLTRYDDLHDDDPDKPNLFG